jgi:hypothetical protein
MLTISWYPTPEVLLVFLAHDTRAEAVFHDWALCLEAPALTAVTRMDGGAEIPVPAIRQPPTVSLTVHVCATGGLARALDLGRDMRSEPDLLILLENGDTGAVPAGPPVPVPVTILTAHNADGSGRVRTAPWAGLTTRSLSFRALPAPHGDLLDAGSPVPGVLTRLVHNIVNPPTQAKA